MRAKKNAITGLMTQLIIIALGLIVPRIMITNYGSDTNGLPAMSMKEMALLKERIYPYVVAVVGVGLIRRSCVIEFFSSENLNDALTAIITVTSIIIGFIGAILPVILSMKNDSKVVQYVFQRDRRKLFLEYIKSTLAIGLLLIVCSIIPYFSDLYEDTFFYKNWPYVVMYMLISPVWTN